MKYINRIFSKCYKKGFFIAFLLFLVFPSFSKESKNQNPNYSVELYSAAKNNFDGITFGAKVKVPFYDVRTYFLKEKWTFGLSVFTNSIYEKIPVSLKIGKLSPGGSFSKLNSPLLSSTVSPFSGVSQTVPYFSCNLPSSSSFEKDLSSFLQIDFIGKNVLKKINFSAFCNLEKKDEFAFGVYGNLIFNKKINLYLSGIAGKFLYEENYKSSWFLDSIYYPKGEHFCGSFQIGLKMPNLFSTFYLGLYQNPFGKFDAIYKIENKIKFQKIILNLSSLYNASEKLITSSNKIINEILELKLGMQYLFTKRVKIPLFFKTGINGYLKMNLAQESHNWKVGVGCQFNSFITSASLIAYCSGQIKTPKNSSFNFDFSTVSLQMKNVWYFKNINLIISGNFSFSPKTITDEKDYYILDYSYLGKVFGKETFSYDMSEKFSINFVYNKMPFITFENSIGFWQNNGSYTKGSYDSSVNLKYKVKFLTLNLKFTMNFDF